MPSCPLDLTYTGDLVHSPCNNTGWGFWHCSAPLILDSIHFYLLPMAADGHTSAIKWPCNGQLQERTRGFQQRTTQTSTAGCQSLKRIYTSKKLLRWTPHETFHFVSLLHRGKPAVARATLTENWTCSPVIIAIVRSQLLEHLNVFDWI